jgi:hypothetical protein
MKPALLAIALSIAFLTSAAAADKGFCPPTPRTWSLTMPAVPDTDAPDRTFLGTVSVLTVVSDKGYFCSARVIQGLAKKLDADALSKVRTLSFKPVKKNGRTIPAVLQIDIQYWKEKDGQIVGVPVNGPQIAQDTKSETAR